MRKAFQFLLLVSLLTSADKVWGQATTSVRGVVTDPGNSVIVGAQVSVVNTDTGFTRSTTTGSDGAYTFVEILPGNYTLSVEAPGFQKYQRLNMVLRVDLPATANVQMRVGTVAEVISITTEAPALNTTDASLGHTMGHSEIEELPLQAENMPLLLSFQPGVVYNGDSPAQLTSTYDTRAGAVNGEHSDQNNLTLDGVSINDQFNGYAFQGVLPTTQFSIEEFRVTTSNYGATDGRSAGAQISMVTKGGTNDFHGSLYEFNRNTAGEANDYFLKATELENGESNTPEHLVRNIFGGTLGGPVIKDRLFFFVNYEGHRISQFADVLQIVPSATLRDGIIEYPCATASQCPGGSVTGESGKTYSVPSGLYALGPTQLAQMDPLGIGPSQVALKYFDTFPLPNDLSQGNTYNYAGFRFPGSTPETDNWYIGRIDYKLTQNGNHLLFLRGAGRDDRSSAAPFLPGTPPEFSTVDLSKGVVGGYTATIGSHWVNNARYGLTHQSVGTPGDTDQPWVQMRGLNQPIVYSSSFTSPVHNVVDTATWIKGSHNFQFGGNLLFIRLHGTNYGDSFSSALTNSDWLSSNGFANENSPLNPAYGCTTTPAGPCYPAVSSSFGNGYDFPLAAMMGIVSEVNAQYNYKVVNPTTASPLNQGAPILRNWATDTYNLFFQDTWRARRTLTLTYGLNYQLMTPITEVDGQQVTPSVNMGDWFNQRAANMAAGIPASASPLIAFAPSGSYYGKTGLYSAQTKNFAPRLGVAWTPHSENGLLNSIFGDGKTVLRAGAGMYYDNFGPALSQQYDASGSFGLTTTLENPAAELNLSNAPRLMSINSIPQSLMEPAPPSTFPVTYPVGAEAIGTGIDQSLKTPYSYAVDLSIQRELPGRITLDIAYVGHFGHRLLGLDDVAAPMDVTDPKTGIDYFKAASRLSQLARANTPDSAINASLIGPTAQYWTDMLQAQSSYPLCSNGGTTNNLLVAVYDLFGPSCDLYNETSALYSIDLFGSPATPKTGLNSYYNSQFSSLWDWRSIGHSSYNGLQIGLHKQLEHDVLFGFNYTYSKTMDIESFAERGTQYLTSSIINPWDINQMYGPADYDLRHQINAYWLVGLPFGHGKAVAGQASGWVNAIIGGWQLGGTTRWTSGFPASVYQSYVWPTNWDEMGWSDLTGQPTMTGTSTSTGVPNIFTNPALASNAFTYAYPGQSGQRNTIRGDGFFNTDMNLSKSWRIPHTENHTLQFRWSAFNVFNSVRFDAFTVQDQVDISSTFGNYSATLTNPREMEFTLIYKF
jgi:hypothetical protein